MSASERLKMLGPAALDALEELSGDADWAHNYQPGGEDAPDRVPDVRAILDALPQLVAVIEAAEAAADEFTHKWLINTLEELDKALS